MSEYNTHNCILTYFFKSPDLRFVIFIIAITNDFHIYTHISMLFISKSNGIQVGTESLE